MADEPLPTTTLTTDPAADPRADVADVPLTTAPGATVRGVRWREVFPFTNLFRAFRVAIQPSKLVLALVALLLLYAGGFLLDAVWPTRDRAVPEEVVRYEQFAGHSAAGDTFQSSVRLPVRGQIEATYARRLLDEKIVATRADADAAARSGKYLGTVKRNLVDRRQAAVDVAAAAKKRAVDAADAAFNAVGDGDKKVKAEAKRAHADAVRRADDEYRATVRGAYAAASADWASVSQVENRGLFDAFFEYEANQVTNVIRGVQGWNWLGDNRVTPSITPAGDDAVNPLSAAVSAAEATGSREAGLIVAGRFADPAVAASPGVVRSVYRFLAGGPLWLLTQHPVFFVFFGGWFLILCSIFGGAISRIAAVHVARDEKLSVRSAVAFSAGKFLSFLCAPLIPMLVLLFAGGLVTVVSLLGNIPGLGPIVVGLAFPLALLAGAFMALLLLGFVGGLNLMYPTIAVEGSDSFDAFSRSFSYVYVRPWRLGFYTLVALVYGAVTYLFVHLVLSLLLVLTHKFVGFGIFTEADSTAPLWPSMWPNPSTAGRLSYDIDTLGLTWAQSIGARLIWLWVHGVIAMLGAFVVSFYFSASTIVYYLMRQEVDATDLNDVYLEQSDDEYADPTPEPAAAAAADAPSAAKTDGPSVDRPAAKPPAAPPAAEPADEVSPPT